MQMTSLPGGLAQEIVRSVTQWAAEQGSRLTVAVVDAAGHLLALGRMDGALLASLDVAVVKARTAVYFGTETGNLPATAPIAGPIAFASREPIALLPGGVPIRHGGQIIGAVGVGGDRAERDQAAAEWGAQRAAEALAA